ncbi:TNT domain-containing protein [Nocardioides hankookensis]
MSDDAAGTVTPPEGEWLVVRREERHLVGAFGRRSFRVYEEVATQDEASQLITRLRATPLHRVGAAFSAADLARGERTAAELLARSRARNERPAPAELQPGDLLDCVGPETGHHLYALGTPFSQRSQPPSDVGAARFAFQLARPFPPEVQEGIAAPWFGQPGGGAMVVLDRPIRWYVDQGYLDPIGEPMPQRFVDFLNGLDKLPPWTGLSFRGLPPGPFPEEGATILAQGVTATSRDPRVATENFAVRGLWAISGRSGRAIEELSAAPDDREVVFRPGSFFKVLKVARLGDLAVVLIDDVAFWATGRQPVTATPLADFARLAKARIEDALQEPPVQVGVPGKFVGPIY